MKTLQANDAETHACSYRHDALIHHLFVLALLKALVPLLLSLSLHLLDQLWRAILDEITLAAEPSPLGQPIWNVHDTLAVEHVASKASTVY